MVRPRSKIELWRCSLKPPLRTKSVGTKVSEAEFASLEERARGAGLTLGEWVREALLAEPEKSGAEVAGEVVLAELLALRTLFLNLRPLPGHGLPTEEEVRAEVARVDGSKRRLIWKHGRRLRGPELVSTAEFNTKLGKSSMMRVHLPDGIMFVNEEGSWYDKLFHKTLSRWVRVPRDREAMHFLIVGDSGTGKSATIRQLLAQIADRGEAAIVYDPAMEYLPQFYNEKRGDVVLNPLDARCPFWTPGDEVPYEAEALTLAVSLFPDQGRENRFFVEAPRKIFAHLINQRPTPQELTYWMSNAEEIDKRVEGTELVDMIGKGAANQRSGVLGSLNMVADAFKLLPKEAANDRE